MRFYDIKMKKPVEIPDVNIKVMKKNNRYMAVGTLIGGRKLYKFISKADFEKL